MKTSDDDLLVPAGAPRIPYVWGLRLLLVAAGLVAWFWTQSLIGQRQFRSDMIGDYVFEVTDVTHGFLASNPRWAHGLLIVSSAIIDLLGVFLLASSIFGRSIRPFLGLLMLFGLRQICQGLCALPAPHGMIWEDPGFPTLLVTYGVSNDLFFSGHTAIAVFGAAELARFGRPWLTGLGALVAIFQAATVLVLRAHYTMDVFTGAVTALYISTLAGWLAPLCDRAIGRVMSGLACCFRVLIEPDVNTQQPGPGDLE